MVRLQLCVLLLSSIIGAHADDVLQKPLLPSDKPVADKPKPKIGLKGFGMLKKKKAKPAASVPAAPETIPAASVPAAPEMIPAASVPAAPEMIPAMGVAQGKPSTNPWNDHQANQAKSTNQPYISHPHSAHQIEIAKERGPKRRRRTDLKGQGDKAVLSEKDAAAALGKLDRKMVVEMLLKDLIKTTRLKKSRDILRAAFKDGKEENFDEQWRDQILIKILKRNGYTMDSVGPAMDEFRDDPDVQTLRKSYDKGMALFRSLVVKESYAAGR